MHNPTSLRHLSLTLLLLLQEAPASTSAFLLPPFMADKLPSISKLRISSSSSSSSSQFSTNFLKTGDNDAPKQNVILPEQEEKQSEEKDADQESKKETGRYSYLSATTPVANAPTVAPAIITGAPNAPSSSKKEETQPKLPPTRPPSITYVPHTPNNSNLKRSPFRQLIRRQQDANGNSGVGNVGYGNSGNFNCGDFNSGNYNDGNGNSGSYNVGNGNSGNNNNGNGQAGNGNGGTSGNGAPCGDVVVSKDQVIIYPAPSTISYYVPAVVTTVVVYQQEVYVTSCYTVPAAPATSVVYYTPIVQPINQCQQNCNGRQQAPRGCEYWAQQGYTCSGAVRTRGGGPGGSNGDGLVWWVVFAAGGVLGVVFGM